MLIAESSKSVASSNTAYLRSPKQSFIINTCLQPLLFLRMITAPTAMVSLPLYEGFTTFAFWRAYNNVSISLNYNSICDALTNIYR